MAIFKCKHCGEALDLALANNGVCKCSVCNMYQTVSLKVESSPNLEMLYGNASHFRKNGEFDLAISVYQQILMVDDEDAEAYFNVALCRYGIEYVKDPRTGSTLPTVNRTQLKAFSDDDDFQMALNYATDAQREIFTRQAELIDEILHGYWQISNNEAPFDVFICYKETAEDGETRTEDSAIAQSLYRELTRDGLKVFYARETLKGKLGSEYEPYIFAALNSARFMLVVGTKKANFNAVWVKNEWSRYLALIAQGNKKTLIPVYRDINAYELPKEFKNLQAQNYAEVGATDNIVLAIENVIKQEKPETVVVKETTTVVENGEKFNEDYLIKRAYESLNEGNFGRANDCIARALNINFENSEIYFLKFLCDNKYKGIADIKARGGNFKSTSSYKKMLEYADDKLRGLLKEIDIEIAYNTAINLMNSKKYDEAVIELKKAIGFKDAVDKLAECVIGKNQIIYDNAISLMNNGKYNEAISEFKVILDFKDSKEKTSECEIAKNQVIYDRAISFMNSQQYEDALLEFRTIFSFKDTQEKMSECNREIAESKNNTIYYGGLVLMNLKRYNEAIIEFKKVIDYKDSRNKIKACETASKRGKTWLAVRIASISIVFALCISLLVAYFLSDSFIYHTYDVDGGVAIGQVRNIEKYIVDGHLDIPNEINGKKVVSIGDSAFKNCTSFTSVTIPDSVTSIGDYAFLGCSELTYNEYDNGLYLGNDSNPYLLLVKAKNKNISECNISSETKFIHSEAFDECKSLTSITIPNNVTSIGRAAFCRCDSLTSITIPDGVTSISNSAFMYCRSLTSITIPDSVSLICGHTFHGCSSLTSVTIPNSVISIGSSAFSGCEDLASITIPDGVTSIEAFTFNSCKSLKNIKIPNGVVSIGNSAFRFCTSLTSITIPDSVTSIGEKAFYYCRSLTSIAIPGNVTSIDKEAFYECDSLTSIIIPDSVTSIGEMAFYDCDSLASVTIPDSVTSIGQQALHTRYSRTTYCEVESKPDGWDISWTTHASGCEVVWGAEMPE